MINMGRKIKICLSMLLTFTMLFGPFLSLVHADGNAPIEIITAKDRLKETALNKLDEDVLEDFENNEYVEVLVYMKEQADTQKVAENVRNSVSQSLTPNSVKLAVRREVVNALKTTSEETQSKLLKYIEMEKTKGNVIEYKPYYIVNMVYVKANKEVVEKISYMAEVERIYKNKTHQLDVVAGEEITPSSEEGLEWNIARVMANKVWEMGIDGTGAVVANIDTGVDWTHPALKNKWRGYNPETGETNPEGNWFDPVYKSVLPSDSGMHGTHVMGTIVGQTPDNIIGVAPGAKWIAARVFDIYGYTTDQVLLDAAQWMLAPGGNPDNAPDVVNNSWGGLDGIDDWYRNAVRNWRAAGILPVFSAGNQREGEPEPWPGSISCPANYPESFAVAAVDRNNLRAYFSKLGPSPYDETLIKPEISAPGVRVRSSLPGGLYGYGSGTSMAAPHVTGAVALLVSANSSLTVDEIEAVLENTATGLTDSDYPETPNFGYGYGLLNAYHAVEAVLSGTGYIRGHVLVEGEDTEEPAIIHNQEVHEAYPNSDVDIIANIADNVSIISAELLIKTDDNLDWESIPMERISGDYKDGTYKGTITSDKLGESKTFYKIKVEDFGGNTVVTDEYEIDILFGIKPDEYEMDFETQPVGWQLTGDWQWGVPGVGVGPIPYNGYRLVGTNLNGPYSNRSNSYLITPPMDLRDESLESVTVRYHQWYRLEDRFDKGYVYVSDNYGEDWVQLIPEITGEGGAVWHEVVLNLNDYIGSENPVFVAFYLVTDGSGQRDGWYIDNFRLVGTDNEPPARITGLTAETGITGVKLTWNQSLAGDLDEYIIYRSEVSGSNYEEIGRTRNNMFMDTEIEGGRTYYYVVTAIDFAGNESEPSNEVSANTFNITTIFYTNFEEDNGGFVTGTAGSGSNNWEWGVPTSGPNAALTGTKVWATNLSGKYSGDHRGYIESPDIVIPEDNDVFLVFDHWIDAELSSSGRIYDYGLVQVSEDNGATWINVSEQITGYIRQWQNMQINLNEFRGKTIKIRFFFFSDTYSNFDGWYIDNVSVLGVVNARSEDLSAKASIIKESSPDFSPVKAEHRVDSIEDIVNKANIDGSNKGTTGIPLADRTVTVTVLETGYSVRTNPANGEFTIRHAANREGESWTLLAEAYGYYPKEVEVSLEENGTVEEIIFLDKIPEGRIVGQVKDRYYGNPAANAVIRVIDDPNIEAVTADENGYFTIENMLEGKHVLKVMADGFEPLEMEVTVVGNQDNEVEIGLRRYVGYDKEMSYDNGIPGNAIVLGEANSGAAVRFTPSEYGKVKGANIYFWDESFPRPGGNEIAIGIFDIDDMGRAVLIGEPKVVNVTRGQWNLIDLSEYEFATDRDFLIATIQTDIGDNSPGIAIDETSEYPERSYVHSDGYFASLSETGLRGGFMIRAIVESSADSPEILNLGDINYTNQDSILIEGTVDADGIVYVYVNGEKHEVETTDRTFSMEVALETEETTIMASLELNGIEGEPSNPIKVIKDQVVPQLNVIRPLDDEKINVEVVHVAGNVYDKHLDKLLINDMEVDVNENGDFYERILVDEGINVINIKAVDLAGNITEEIRTVVVRLGSGGIQNIEPHEDITLTPGEILTVRFNAEPDGAGRFRIVADVMPSGNSGTWIDMEESGGLYEGTLVIPENFEITNGLIEIEYTDFAGNTDIYVAPGRLTVVPERGIELTNIEPYEDMVLKAGEVLEVSFNGPEGGEAYFKLRLPYGTDNANKGIEMVEETPGFYRGTWTVPEGLIVENLRIDISFISLEGKDISATARGRVTIVPYEDALPMEDLPVNAVIVGDEAYDIYYLNNNSNAQARLIQYFNEGKEIYIKLSQDTIVNIEGRIAGMEELPDELTYYDANGQTTRYVK